jgi:hypothetical protein
VPLCETSVIGVRWRLPPTGARLTPVFAALGIHESWVWIVEGDALINRKAKELGPR